MKKEGKHSNKNMVNIIENGLKKLKEDIYIKMSKNEIEIKKPNEIVNSVKRILDFNNQNGEGQGLKILIPE